MPIEVCSQCGGAVVPSVAEQARVVAKTSFIVRAPVLSCRQCDAVFMTGQALQAVDLRVAAYLAVHAPPDGERLRFMRKSLGLRGVAFAALVGVTSETVSRWENGQRPVDRNVWILVGSLVLEQIAEPTATLERLSKIGEKRQRVPRLVHLDMSGDAHLRLAR